MLLILSRGSQPRGQVLPKVHQINLRACEMINERLEEEETKL